MGERLRRTIGLVRETFFRRGFGTQMNALRLRGLLIQELFRKREEQGPQGIVGVRHQQGAEHNHQRHVNDQAGQPARDVATALPPRSPPGVSSPAFLGD